MPRLIEQFIEHEQDRGLLPAGINQSLSRLAAFFHYPGETERSGRQRRRAARDRHREDSGEEKGNARQRFQVVGANLKAGAAYTLFVTINGTSVQVATETAEVDEGEEKDEDESGAAVEFIFFQKAKGKIGEDERPLPAALDPLTQITAVTLRDSAGNVVLSGNFPQ